MAPFNEDTIKNIFCEVLGLPAQNVTDTLAYNSCEQWDSLKHLQIVAMFEESFGIEIDMDDIIAMETYGKVKEILHKYLT
ncbi:acyl carrier protein [Methanoregula sp.]|uniref:acyl carrier protein n=1 Tax=Methanoregula sp. TaxID=2052170 RepID=UPI00236FFDC4|nr:acyl carrier protein [Methanoregula sp.]MDD1687184.1 acyl carrier protein [Methanoregula sp.]